jgi:hypothetical protein
VAAISGPALATGYHMAFATAAGLALTAAVVSAILLRPASGHGRYAKEESPVLSSAKC